jgi:hypothetical protein
VDKGTQKYEGRGLSLDSRRLGRNCKGAEMGLKRTPLKRGNKPLKRTALRRITPKQAKRQRQQAQGTQQAVIEADGICPKCHKPFTEFNPASSDHIIQRGKGGTDDPKNKRLRCLRCHEKRHNGTAREQHPENFTEQDRLK